MAKRLTGSDSDAAELTQDVFVAAWKSYDGFRGESAVSTWLTGITIRLARQRWRTLFRRRAREERVPEQLVSRESPDGDLDVERAIACLPPKMRSVVVLHCVYGYTQQETAGFLGIAEGTVKAHVHHARKLMQTFLEYE